MRMKLSHLNHILAVAQAGTFARAAEAEGITQPALSHSIANFEKDYRLRLFDRGRGGVAATKAGTLVLEHARQIMSAVDALDRSLRLFSKGEAGQIAFGLGPHLASMLLPTVSATLLRSRPGLQIKPAIGPTEMLLGKLMDGAIEFIVGHSLDVGMAPRLEIEPLFTLHLTVLARSGHPLGGGKRLKLADLRNYPVASALHSPDGLGGGLICDNFHILREVVEQTECIWVSSPAFVSRQLEDGRLIQLDVADLTPKQIEVAVISRPDRTRSPAALALIEELRATLATFSQQVP